MYFGENACFHCRNDGIFVEIGVKSVSERIRKMKKGVYEFKGRRVSLKELSEMSGKDPRLISRRISRGWSVERAVAKPVQGTDSYEGRPLYSLEDIEPFIHELNDRQKLIIQMRLDNKTQKQIAARLNITQQGVSKIEKGMLQKYLPEKC